MGHPIANRSRELKEVLPLLTFNPNMDNNKRQMPKQRIHITTYNTNGLRTGGKRAKIFNALNPNAFCFLQETHSLPGDNWHREWAGPSLWSNYTNFSAGTAILLPKSAQIQHHALDAEGRFVLAKITNLGKPYTLCCIYAPDKPYRRPQFWTRLKRELLRFKPAGEIIIAGDFNSVLDPSKDREGGNPNLPQHTCGNAELVAILDELCLADSCDTQSIGFTWKSEAKRVRSPQFFLTKYIKRELRLMSCVTSKLRKAKTYLIGGMKLKIGSVKPQFKCVKGAID